MPVTLIITNPVTVFPYIGGFHYLASSLNGFAERTCRGFTMEHVGHELVLGSVHHKRTQPAQQKCNHQSTQGP